MTVNNVVTIRGLDHRYGATHALRGVDLTVAAGECVALLGPNGAGKTTLVGALTGMLAPSAGIARIDGADPRRPATRRRLGVVHQQAGFPRTLKVRELVSGWAVRAGRPASDAEAVLTEVGLHDLTKRRVTALSGGQQQRLQLAMALVVDPTLLVLDEPTVGLDIDARRRFWATLAARRDRGTAVLLTTHQIEEAAAVADRVVVLHEGTVIASGHPADLTAQLPDRTVTARTALRDSELRALPDVLDVTVADGRMRAASARAEATVQALLAADPTLSDLRVEGATLEQAIVAMTTQESQEVAA
ncbi:MAG: ABC transporter ATP-binding protein [Jiangellaceae bacterium]|jgi:ABC-2 type transport system ATP-binding protein